MNNDRTPLDYAIWATAALIVVLLGYLGYAVWAQRAYDQSTSPVARAVANLEAVVRKQPSSAGARLRLASAYGAAGRLNDAEDQYRQVLRLEKENPAALVGLGEIAMKTEKWSLAEGYWQRVITKLQSGEFSVKDDRLEKAYYYLGCVDIQEHRYDDAVANLKAASRIRPDAADTWYAMALAYKELGQQEQAVEKLKVALAFDPQMPEANYDYAEALLRQGDMASAAEHFRIAADKAPDIDKPRVALQKLGPVEARIDQARSLTAAGRIASATVEARVAVAVDPHDAIAVRLLAQLWERLGQKDKALATYQKLQELLPDDKDAAAAVTRLKNGGKS